MDYFAPLGPVYQAGTLSGNPLAMAAGIASLTLLKEESPYERLNNFGNTLAQGLREIANDKGILASTPDGVYVLFIF